MSQILNTPKQYRPKPTPFRQQQLTAYRMIPSVRKTCLILLSIGVVYILIGILILIYTLQITQTHFRYDNIQDCKHHNSTESKCEVQFEIKNAKSPVFIYYELDNFYQNHRNYVRSRSYEQLQGEDLGQDDLDSCDPVLHMKDIPYSNTTQFSDDQTANPCGLVARSFFNDTYQIYDISGRRIEIQEDNIIWESELIHHYHRINSNWKSIQWLDVENGIIYIEHFINWMKTEILPSFIKLWGRINEDLDGMYILQIFSRYDTSRYDSGKYVLLSTANALGGSQMFLAVSFIAFGVTCLAAMCGFLIKDKTFTLSVYVLKHVNYKF